METISFILGLLGLLNVANFFILTGIRGELKEIRQCREKDRDATQALENRLTKLETEHNGHFGRRSVDHAAPIVP